MRIEEHRFRRTSTLTENILSFEEVEKEKILLTRDVGLPVRETLPDVLRFEFFSYRAVLIIGLQATDDKTSLSVSEEFRAVREVLNDPEGHGPCHHRRETFQNKNPRPTGFPTNPIHLRDCDLLGE